MPASQPTNQPTHQTTSHNRHNGRDARLNCGGWRYPMIAAAALAALAATIPSVSLVHHAPERVEACLRLPSTHPRPNVFGRDRCQSTVRATQIRPVSELAGKLSALLHRPSHAEVVVRVDGVLRNVVKGDASKAAFCCSRASRSLLASKHAGVEEQRFLQASKHNVSRRPLLRLRARRPLPRQAPPPAAADPASSSSSAAAASWPPPPASSSASSCPWLPTPPPAAAASWPPPPASSSASSRPWLQAPPPAAAASCPPPPASSSGSSSPPPAAAPPAAAATMDGWLNKLEP